MKIEWILFLFTDKFRFHFTLLSNVPIWVLCVSYTDLAYLAYGFNITYIDILSMSLYIVDMHASTSSANKKLRRVLMKV